MIERGQSVIFSDRPAGSSMEPVILSGRPTRSSIAKDLVSAEAPATRSFGPEAGTAALRMTCHRTA